MSDASKIVDIMDKKGLVLPTHRSTCRYCKYYDYLKRSWDSCRDRKKYDTLYGYLSNLNLKEIEGLNTLLDKARN